MYYIKLDKASKKAYSTYKANDDMMSIWDSRLAHADINVVTEKVWDDAVFGLSMIRASLSNKCSPCV